MKENETGKIHETVVFRVESRSFLKKFQENNEIQGLVGVRKDTDAQAAYLHWACVVPHNNIKEYGAKKYSGVGGHLFAIAADKSIQWGFGGAMHGFAANEKLLEQQARSYLN